MNHFLASSIFGQICFPKSLPVPESEPEFEYLHLNESFPTYLITFSGLSTETRMFQ